MGLPSDQKDPSGLPIYAPLPTNENAADSDVTERRRRRRGMFLKNAAFLSIAGFLWFCVFHQKNDFYRDVAAYQQEHLTHAEWDSALEGPAHPPFEHDEEPPLPDVYCARWTNDSAPENSTFSYSFPINASVPLRLVSRGPLIGHVKYVLGEKGANSAFVNASITLKGVHHSSEHKHAHEHGHEEKENAESMWAKIRAMVFGGKWKKTPSAKLCLRKNKDGVPFSLEVVTRKPWWHPHHDGKEEDSTSHPKLPHPYFPHPRIPHPYFPRPSPPPGSPDRHPGPPPPPEDDSEHKHPHHGHKHPHHKHPHHRHKHPHHEFPLVHAEITITIPRGELYLPSLGVIFPGMTHSIGDVFDNVVFGNLAIVSRSGTPETIVGKRATLITSGEEPINGSYTVSEKLSIIAHEAPITAKVAMIGTQDAKIPTTVEIVTHNGTIASDFTLSLNSTSDSIASNNGSYKISTITSNASISSHILSQPLSSHLHFTAVTKNSDVNASFAPAYEGSFTLVASQKGESHVEANEDAEDPAGEGRTRRVKLKTVIGSLVTGEVGWFKDDLAGASIAAPIEIETNEEEDWEMIDLFEAFVEEVEEQGVGEALTGGWSVMEKFDNVRQVKRALQSMEMEGEYAEGSKISLITSSGKNSLYFD